MVLIDYKLQHGNRKHKLRAVVHWIQTLKFALCYCHVKVCIEALLVSLLLLLLKKSNSSSIVSEQVC